MTTNETAMKFVLLPFLLCMLVVSGNSQEKFYSSGETGYVTSLRANLRGTPTESGKIITVLDRDQTFTFIKQSDEWFLIQAPDYVGWIHGNVIKLGSPTKTEPRVPQTTTRSETDSSSPFSSVYVGSDVEPTITINNSSERRLTLLFGGVKYIIEAGKSRSITVEGGNYEYRASAPRVRPASGVKRFSRGYAYSWTFYIQRVYRE